MRTPLAILAALALSACVGATPGAFEDVAEGPALTLHLPGAAPARCDALVLYGIGGATFSPVYAGVADLKRMGCRVTERESKALGTYDDQGEFNVVIGHSLGGLQALRSPPGPRLIFTLDPASIALGMSCPKQAWCTNYFNPLDGINIIGAVSGADNVDCAVPGNCGLLDMIPVIAHVGIAGSNSIWRDIEARIKARSDEARELGTALGF